MWQGITCKFRKCRREYLWCFPKKRNRVNWNSIKDCQHTQDMLWNFRLTTPHNKPVFVLHASSPQAFLPPIWYMLSVIHAIIVHNLEEVKTVKIFIDLLNGIHPNAYIWIGSVAIRILLVEKSMDKNVKCPCENWNQEYWWNSHQRCSNKALTMRQWIIRLDKSMLKKAWVTNKL